MVIALPKTAYPPLAPTKRTWFKIKDARLFVLINLGCAPGKIRMSPLAGTPANPQFPVSFQLPLAPPPDQLRVAASLASSENKPIPIPVTTQRKEIAQREVQEGFIPELLRFFENRQVLF
jgi:hypothetical protein